MRFDLVFFIFLCLVIVLYIIKSRAMGRKKEVWGFLFWLALVVCVFSFGWTFVVLAQKF